MPVLSALQAFHLSRGKKVFASTVLLLSLFGCREKGVPIYPVEGEVVWSDGRPAQELVRGTVSLRGGNGINPNAEIQSDGTFKLHTRGCAGPPMLYNPIGWWDRHVRPPKWGT